MFSPKRSSYINKKQMQFYRPFQNVEKCLLKNVCSHLFNDMEDKLRFRFQSNTIFRVYIFDTCHIFNYQVLDCRVLISLNFYVASIFWMILGILKNKLCYLFYYIGYIEWNVMMPKMLLTLTFIWSTFYLTFYCKKWNLKTYGI